MYPIDEQWSRRMDTQVSAGHIAAKLAFTRLSFNYFITEAVFEYVVGAIHLVASEGWKLLALYRFDPDTGLWHHRARDLEPPLRIIEAAGAAPPSDPLPDASVSEEFERIRWFPLPGEGLVQPV